jgi:hypothetical protein
MPCHVDPPTSTELKFADDVFKDSVALFDDLTHTNDVLREAVLHPETMTPQMMLKHGLDTYKARFDDLSKRSRRSFVTPNQKYIQKAGNAYAEFLSLIEVLVGSTKLTKKERARIEASQTEHRVEDLKRLAKVAIDNWDMDLLKKITSADKTKPLEPQLGFDPDSM